MKPSTLPRCLAAALPLLALLGCGQGERTPTTGAASAAARGSAAPRGSASAPAPPGAASAAASAAGEAPMVASFLGAKSTKECNGKLFQLAKSQPKGELALAGGKETLGAAWRVKLPNKPDDQVAFASYDQEGKTAARTRGVGLSGKEMPLRVFATGESFVVVWLDNKGLAYVRPKPDPFKPFDTPHLASVTPDSAGDVALGQTAAGGVLAATPYGADKAQLGLFQFAAESGPAVQPLGVTHHAKGASRPTVAADGGGAYLAWQERDGAIKASHFDAKGKETDAACTVVGGAGGEARDRFSLVATTSGAIAMWMEGTAIRTRALDKLGCPASPVWTVALGKWASIAAAGDQAVVVWASLDKDAKVLAARLSANGAPPAKGIEASEGSIGAKDPPAVAAFGTRIAFGWSEHMSSVITTKNVMVRLVDLACLP